MKKISILTILFAFVSVSAFADSTHKYVEGPKAKALYQALVWAGVPIVDSSSAKGGLVNVTAKNLKCDGVVEGVTDDLLATAKCSIDGLAPANLQLTASAMPIAQALEAIGVYDDPGMSQFHVYTSSISCTYTDTLNYACNVVWQTLQ